MQTKRANPTAVEEGSRTAATEGAITTLTVTSPAVSAAITVMLEPDAIATGQVAVVYRVDKL